MVTKEERAQLKERKEATRKGIIKLSKILHPKQLEKGYGEQYKGGKGRYQRILERRVAYQNQIAKERQLESQIQSNKPPERKIFFRQPTNEKMRFL